MTTDPRNPDPLATVAPNSLPVPEIALDSIEAQWIGRCKAQSIKPQGKTYANLEREFFIGAMAALIAMHPECFIPPRWCFKLLGGRPIIEAKRHMQGAQ